MSGVDKVKSFLPLGPPSDDESKKSPVPPRKDKVAIYAKSAAVGSSNSNISPVPTPHKNVINNKAMMMYHGQKLLTPVPGRLTPTNGRIKAPPVGPSALRRDASSIDEFNMAGVCFSPKEAEGCAEKAMMMEGKLVVGLDGNTIVMGGSTNNNCMDEMPLNLGNCWNEGHSWKGTPVPEGSKTQQQQQQQFVSSSSTVITTSSAGSSFCGRGTMGNEIAVVASVAMKKDPPLEVVRTSVNAEDDDNHRLGNGGSSGGEGEKPVAVKNQPPPPLSTSFTNNLIKGNSSRQGRSLQRWLVHSPTEELVRQVAGCIPITRDGRIILVSASRKNEWILPKGGWDTDETKEECATRETYEEAGLLGRLGACLEPIDYETHKAKKRRMKTISEGSGEKAGNGKKKMGESNADGGKVERKREASEPDTVHPHPSKRVKTEDASETSPLTSPDLTPSAKKASSTSESAVVSSTDNTTSAAASSLDPTHYSYVRLFLFPLYVSSVKAEWPERGRLRKLVSIDEAIKIMEAENRPYFRRGLELIKEHGLLKPGSA